MTSQLQKTFSQDNTMNGRRHLSPILFRLSSLPELTKLQDNTNRKHYTTTPKDFPQDKTMNGRRHPSPLFSIFIHFYTGTKNAKMEKCQLFTQKHLLYPGKPYFPPGPKREQMY